MEYRGFITDDTAIIITPRDNYWDICLFDAFGNTEGISNVNRNKLYQYLTQLNSFIEEESYSSGQYLDFIDNNYSIVATIVRPDIGDDLELKLGDMSITLDTSVESLKLVKSLLVPLLEYVENTDKE